jgi:beta-N-acetylhexosaminidase
MKRINILSISFLSIITFLLLHSQASNIKSHEFISGRQFIPPLDFSTPWVDSVLGTLSLDEKIAQLLMIEVRTDQNRRYYDRVGKLLTDYNVGGVVFFRGGPMRQARLTNQWQRQMKTPFLVAMDAEWGLSMRLDSTISFPRQMTLGAITNERLIYELGLEMGWQCKRMGVHINFSPVVDVNSNPANPVINSRSFGEDRYNVARKGIALMTGMQDAGIIATAKHFPGHGDTDTDSHHTLPFINKSVAEIDSIHIFPFRHLIEQGLYSVMIAHLDIPKLADETKLPSSLSRKIVTELLQDQMGFKGLVVTDGLNMKGVSNYFSSGELELRALMAGNDILLMPENVPQAIRHIRQAIEKKELDEEYLNYKCRKVLYFKELAGLDKIKPIALNNLVSDLNAPRVENLNQRLAEAAITIIRNENDLLPLQRLDTMRIAALSIGSAVENPFQAMLGNYAAIQMYSIDKNHTPQQAQNMIKTLSRHNLVIISVQNNSMFPGRNYGITPQTISLINELSKTNNVVLNLFANPYSLKSFGPDILNVKSLMISYQDERIFEEASAQIIFGAIPARGRLPVSISPWFPAQTGIFTPGKQRVQFKSPDDVGINQQMLGRIDSIVLSAIAEKAFPGCQVAIIKDGALVYNKSFGFHTYENTIPVKNSDIYDLASLTKIAATTLAIMRLSDQGKFQVDQNMGNYLPWLKGSNKANLRIREVLAHQARLRSWIPVHLSTLIDGQPNPDIYQTHNSANFTIPVSENLFIISNYRDTIFKTILTSDLLNQKRYIYSDLGFMLMAEMVYHITGQKIDEYMQKEFFAPLGLTTMGYNPLRVHDKQRIVPTELDTLFRRQLIHGYVHDPAAAMLGGVAGHAGLFSNARDMAVLMQMILQDGSYGGIQYVKPETIKEFTRTQYAGNKNRRALGFDKPTITPGESSPACASASAFSYGHSGFTGTYAWADPKENLVYVFLSNRVHPDAANRTISKLEVRTRVQQAIYDAIYLQRFITTTRLP